MKKNWGKKISLFAVLSVMVVFCVCARKSQVLLAEAKQQDETVLDGVYIEEISLAGMTKEQAKVAVGAYVEELKTRVVTFGAVEEHYIAIVAGDLGLTWTNEEVIDEAVALGKDGNIVERYKAIQDLKHGNKVYDLELAFDKELIRNVLEEQCTAYDVPAVNYALKKTENGFEVIEGQTGLAVNVDESLTNIYDYLTTDWDFADASIDLQIEVTQPKGDEEQLSKVSDVLGTYTTSYAASSAARCKNVENGTSRINGVTLYPGEEFSACDTMKPFTESNGYYPAGAYLNGKVIESIGGGICQVSTTLYNALLLSELEITQRSSHSMIVDYVEPSMDAAIAENGGKDLKFVNNLDYPIYIEGYTANKKVTFVIYGVETRDSTHKVSFESETLSVTKPNGEVITTTGSQPVGYIDVQKAHTGYTAQLWKIVTENGVEVSREVINKSTYSASPRTATVGVATSDAVYAARIQAAIATGSIDTVKAEVAAIKAEEMQAAQQQAAIQAILEAQQQLPVEQP